MRSVPKITNNAPNRLPLQWRCNWQWSNAHHEQSVQSTGCIAGCSTGSVEEAQEPWWKSIWMRYLWSTVDDKTEFELQVAVWLEFIMPVTYIRSFNQITSLLIWANVLMLVLSATDCLTLLMSAIDMRTGVETKWRRRMCDLGISLLDSTSADRPMLIVFNVSFGITHLFCLCVLFTCSLWTC